VPSGGGVSGVRDIEVIICGAHREYVLGVYGNINILFMKMKLNIYSLY